MYFYSPNRPDMNIIVTGASQGIGNEIVKIFSRSKKNQIMAISRHEKRLTELVAECRQLNPEAKVIPYAFDITQFDFYSLVVQRLETFMPQCDILINNAGILIQKPFEKTEPADFDEVFNVNVKALYFFTQAILPMMTRGGHIVNIGSVGGVPGSRKFDGLSLYSASKAAVSVLTESLAEELKEQEIRVNCLALGSADTEMFRKAFPKYKAAFSANHMAQYIVDFATNGWKHFNGKTLQVAVTTP